MTDPLNNSELWEKVRDIDGDLSKVNISRIVEIIEQEKLAARIEEFQEAEKYIDLDYTECHGWKCRVPYCGSCQGEDEAHENSERLKKERADRIAQLQGGKEQ